MLVHFDTYSGPQLLDAQWFAPPLRAAITAKTIPIPALESTFVTTLKTVQGQRCQWHKQIVARTQTPLRLAWAITVHKCQGLTVDHISVHLGREDVNLNAPLLFVACSRVKQLRGLRMSPLALDVMNHVKTTPNFVMRVQ